ncbi:MAG: ATP-binding cassette domain-containing protein, partial [Firmicutes bacterium]|nr:ATP-binding cassette domain-containing protein [Bacillota bacterium]MDY5857157.1 ATP-binding cassette domain-containing protein [Anaerovoracaceae bacterium]
VCFPLELVGVKRAEAREKGMELLRLVGLQDKALAYPAQLSGGQQQRAAIARALATTPRVLLCDEATSALDPATTLSILDLIQDINRRLGITVILITHQMHVVQRICRHVAILEQGQIVEQGPVSDVFHNPKSQAAKQLVFSLSMEVGENV